MNMSFFSTFDHFDEYEYRAYESLKFEIGDLVIISRKCPSHFGGWRNSWNPDMSKYLGRICMIYDMGSVYSSSTGISLTGTIGFKFPAYSLTKLIPRKDD